MGMQPDDNHNADLSGESGGEDSGDEINVRFFANGRVSRLGATTHLLCAFTVAQAPNTLVNEVFKLLHGINFECEYMR